MKLKAIATIFKRNKFLRIWNAPNGTQWITNGAAVYSMAGMPELSPATVLKIFDIPEDKQAEWNCEVEPMPSEIYDRCIDCCAITPSLDPKETMFQYNGITYLLSSGNGEIVPIDEKFIKPLYDDMDYLRYYKCKLKRGFAVACYDGLQTTAVIMPIRIADTLAKELLEIATYFNTSSYRMIADGIAERITPEIITDSETGEVLNGDSDELQETLQEGADNGKDG